jgi:hypothetical protein
MRKIIIATVFLVFMFMGTVSAQPNCVTNDGYLAAASEELFETAMGYMFQKDFVALQRLVDSGLIVFMKEGVPVYREKVRVFKGRVAIRLPGSTGLIWTHTEAVTCR